MVCQSCDPVDLLAQDPCPLSQPILLSLIQQLSVDLSSDTELKHRYDISFAIPFAIAAAILEVTKMATSGSHRKPGLIEYVTK